MNRAEAEQCDRDDPLAPLRQLFQLPEGVIYLDGNSLGALPRAVPARVHQTVVQEWGNGLIRSWNDAEWYPAPFRIGAKIAKLVGAGDSEVVVCDSTSVNLFKIMMAAARMRPDRSIIVSETGNFPTNAYITSEVARLNSMQVVFVAQADVGDAIESAGAELAFVQLTEVNFKTSERHDMAAITKLTQAQGGLMVWDLCHSAGAFPVDLETCGADFAVGCTYKYLNGGPGAPAFVYVASRHIAFVEQPIPGWHGHAQPFAFAQHFTPDPGIGRMLAGTASQIGLLALEAALEVFDGIDMAAVRTKSVALTDLFIDLVDEELAGHGFTVSSPRDSVRRGSHVSIAHPQAYAITQALVAARVIPDFRDPDLIRFGFTPLYTQFSDVYDAVAVLRQIMAERSWDRPQFYERTSVT